VAPNAKSTLLNSGSSAGWSDGTAIQYLTGFPIMTPGTGEIWTSLSSNIPFVLTTNQTTTTTTTTTTKPTTTPITSTTTTTQPTTTTKKNRRRKPRRPKKPKKRSALHARLLFFATRVQK
jgi:hypothetical protein